MKLRAAFFIALAVFAVLGAVAYLATGHALWTPRGLTKAANWQRMANPGELSRPHAFLDHNCAACHTPVQGVTAANCIVCHASDLDVLQRQPTAFHSDIGNCVACHQEHRGLDARPVDMDHSALARIGLRQIESNPNIATEATQLAAWLHSQGGENATFAPHSKLTAGESVLNCATCHTTKDQHFGLFGTNCASCHGTAAWTIAEFRHPAAASMDCAQCHQAPPSHYMGHFNMISMKVAGKPHAKVSECYTCHQTTSWNDIKSVGWYKHH